MSRDEGRTGPAVSLTQVVNGLFGVLLAVGGWFLVTAWGDIQGIRENQHQFEQLVAQDYVRRDDLDEVKAALLRIEDKLDRKADKAG